MLPFHHISLILDQKHLLARFWQSASQSWQTQRASVAALGGFLIVVVLFNYCCKSHSICGIGTSLMRSNARTQPPFGHKRDCSCHCRREYFSRRHFGVGPHDRAARLAGGIDTPRYREMARENRFRHLNHHLTKGTENPEYRIAVDVRIATDAPIDLALAFFSSIVTAITFFGVLWR